MLSKVQPYPRMQVLLSPLSKQVSGKELQLRPKFAFYLLEIDRVMDLEAVSGLRFVKFSTAHPSVLIYFLLYRGHFLPVSLGCGGSWGQWMLSLQLTLGMGLVCIVQGINETKIYVTAYFR